MNVIQNNEKFYFIAVDITNNCNLRCTFCFNDFSKTKTHFMTEEVYEKILKLLPLVEDGNFYISCLYEPTIHPQFIQFLEKIPKSYRKKVFFTTNLSTYIPDDVIERMSHIDLHHINISIDSFNPTIFEKLRKGAKFDRFIDNLERLVSFFSCSSDAPPLHYITIVLKSNFDEIPLIVEKCSKSYMAKMHEARWIFMGSHVNPSNFKEEWKQNNLISNEDWIRLQKYADNCQYNFIVSQPPLNYYPDDKQPYSRCSNNSSNETIPLALSISSDGIVNLYGHNDVQFNINNLKEDPYTFFKKKIKTFQPSYKKKPWDIIRRYSLTNLKKIFHR